MKIYYIPEGKLGLYSTDSKMYYIEHNNRTYKLCPGSQLFLWHSVFGWTSKELKQLYARRVPALKVLISVGLSKRDIETGLNMIGGSAFGLIWNINHWEVVS